MDKEKMLKRAKEHCFFICLKDSGAELCKANSIYGIAAIHYIQKKLGFKPDATFITTPDMTITRNINRWNSGIGYGGKISWGDGKHEFIILNTKPNACGMLVGGLEELPDISSVIKKLYELEKETFKIDDIEIKWDFYKSNHFIDVFELKSVLKTDEPLPPYAFIIHGSVGELTRDNKMGFGLYYDQSKQLYDMAEHIDTPFGMFHILTGKKAKEYFQRFKYAEDFAKKKRRLAAELIFPNFTEITNETHQGLINLNEILLGCHHTQKNHKLYPLVLRGDLPAYLVRGLPSLTSEVIDLLGFARRAKKTGVYKRLKNLNIIPHGGGYILPDILTVNRVIEIQGKRYYEAEMLNDRGKKIVSEVRELPFDYRGRMVVLRALEVGLLEIVAKLIPKYVFKI